MEIEYLPRFNKRYKRLPSNIKTLFEKKEALFKLNPHNPELNTHKLIGKFSGYLAFSVNYKYRVIFRFKSYNEVYFVAIGGHEVYK